MVNASTAAREFRAIARDGRSFIARAHKYEREFVETAILIFGHMLLKAPGLEERRWLAGVLQAIAVDQIGYFERTFAELGITREHRQRPLPPSVLQFRDGMLTIARDGGYLDGVAITLAAEWMYATWCSRAAKRAIGDPIVRRWVDLHAEPGFLAQADSLRRRIDAADPSEEASLGRHFSHALELEIGFHTAPFEGRRDDDLRPAEAPSWPRPGGRAIENGASFPRKRGVFGHVWMPASRGHDTAVSE